MRPALFALALSCAAPAVSAQDIALSLPIDCDLGRDCFIQQYKDRDPGDGARDYTCNGLSYDGHSGTDFALPTRRDIARDVPVVAAAPGDNITPSKARDDIDTARAIAGISQLSPFNRDGIEGGINVD